MPVSVLWEIQALQGSPFFIPRSLCGISGAHVLLRLKLIYVGEKRTFRWVSVEKGPLLCLKMGKYLFYQTLWLTPLVWHSLEVCHVIHTYLLWRSSRQIIPEPWVGVQNRQKGCITLPFFIGQSLGHLLFKVKYPQATWLMERKETTVPSQSG